MKTYIYRADLYCEDCVEGIMENGLDENDQKERYDDYINERTGRIEIAGIELSVDAARILEEYDPTAYDCGFSDWLDGELKAGIFLDAESSDPDDFPQECNQEGGGEADGPQHCGDCGVFLENALTTDGDTYVKEHWDSMDEDIQEFYSYLEPEEEI